MTMPHYERNLHSVSVRCGDPSLFNRVQTGWRSANAFVHRYQAGSELASLFVHRVQTNTRSA